MNCAGKRRGTRCIGPATRRCGRCRAVAYCSVSHQIAHWGEHKGECERFEEQMEYVDLLNDFPFTFSQEATLQVCEKQETRCSFLSKLGLHKVGMWTCECCCGSDIALIDHSRVNDCWNLPSSMCPCTVSRCHTSKHLSSWKDYYEWRNIPLDSPVALLLHWPLFIYHSIQITGIEKTYASRNELRIHYLGPEKELSQLASFTELRALFPGVHVYIDFIGPAIPQKRDGEKIYFDRFAYCNEIKCICRTSSENANCGIQSSEDSEVTVHLHRGLYHEHFAGLTKESFPHLVIAPNAGIAAYSSWLPTIEVLKQMNVPVVFSDYCEEACNLAANCISAVTGHPPSLPIQLNPFRQPIAVEDSALLLPCYSNCFLFGM